MKIITILGARPQFIKAATVSRAIHKFNSHQNKQTIQEVIVHTGQHFDSNMSHVFFEQLDIPKPQYNLEIANLHHGAMTGRMMEGIEKIVLKEKADWVLVYGDTNSTLAGALVAAKLHIPVAHVEAGLRSNNFAMPEEVNRVLTDRVSAILFCPTKTAADNLKREGYPFTMVGGKKQILDLVGDVMYDAVLFYKEIAKKEILLDRWGIADKKYILCTLHRQENTNDAERLKNILAALREISKTCTVIIPLHPRTRNMLSTDGRQNWLDGLTIVDPVPYLEMQRLEMSAKLILTDSGGVQKEAYFHKVPCITLRDETEWLETIELGWNRIVGADSDNIIKATTSADEPPLTDAAPFGVGNAAELIVGSLAKSS